MDKESAIEIVEEHYKNAIGKYDEKCLEYPDSSEERERFYGMIESYEYALEVMRSIK